MYCSKDEGRALSPPVMWSGSPRLLKERYALHAVRLEEMRKHEKVTANYPTELLASYIQWEFQTRLPKQ
jgi:hypothetical protein